MVLVIRCICDHRPLTFCALLFISREGGLLKDYEKKQENAVKKEYLPHKHLQFASLHIFMDDSSAGKRRQDRQQDKQQQADFCI